MKTYIALCITVVWAISYIGSVVTSDFTGFEVSTPVMIIVASALLTLDIYRKRNGN